MYPKVLLQISPTLGFGFGTLFKTLHIPVCTLEYFISGKPLDIAMK